MAIESLVVDDEPLARDLLAGYVKQTPFLHFAGACSSAVEALTVLQREKIDLIFLDIQMPQLNGLELSRMIGTQTRVVFTTAFEQYALEGFRVDALDYRSNRSVMPSSCGPPTKRSVGSGFRTANRRGRLPRADPRKLFSSRPNTRWCSCASIRSCISKA